MAVRLFEHGLTLADGLPCGIARTKSAEEDPVFI
jgi:hypothetical protein